MKNLGLGLLLVILAISSVSCDQTRTSDEIGRSDTLIMAFEAGPAPAPYTANPFSMTAWYNQGLLQTSMESLFYLNYQTGESDPWQAKGYEYNTDATELTIFVREGVRWSDGELFTAEDIAFTLNMLKETAPALWRSDIIDTKVESVEVLDDYTVRIHFASPEPRFVLDYFSAAISDSIVIIPKHIWEGQDPIVFANFDLERGWPVFTGPYLLLSSSETEFVFERDDDWWAAESGFHDLPAPRRLVFTMQGPEETRAAQLENGDVDSLTQISFASFEEAHARNNAIGAWFDESPYGWIDPCPLYLDVNTKTPPWDDPEMRWVLNYAIDQERFANVSFEGYGQPAEFLFPNYPPLQTYLDDNRALFAEFPVLEQNQARAREILEGRGYFKEGDFYISPEGNTLEIDLVMMSPDEGGIFWELATLALVEDLQEIGIKVNSQYLAYGIYFDSGMTGDYEIRVHWSCGSVVDPYQTLDRFHSRWVLPIGEAAQNNYSRWSNERYDQLVDQIGALQPGDPAIRALVDEAMEIWIQELPAIPLAQQVRIYPYNTTYWINWPTADNPYTRPQTQDQVTHQTIINLKPAQ